jgi:hypothetical protein
MHRARLFCAIGITVWSVVSATGQVSAPAALSATLRNHVKDERFDAVSSIRGLPLGVRDELQTLFGTSTLDIADDFQTTDRVGNPARPIRRLIAAGCSTDHCIVHYERGGSTPAWLVALFHWTPAATRFEWGGNARGRLATIDDVRSAVLSAAVKGPVKQW